jgi:hypothetical protein
MLATISSYLLEYQKFRKLFKEEKGLEALP